MPLAIRLFSTSTFINLTYITLCFLKYFFGVWIVWWHMVKQAVADAIWTSRFSRIQEFHLLPYSTIVQFVNHMNNSPFLKKHHPMRLSWPSVCLHHEWKVCIIELYCWLNSAREVKTGVTLGVVSHVYFGRVQTCCFTRKIKTTAIITNKT